MANIYSTGDIWQSGKNGNAIGAVVPGGTLMSVNPIDLSFNDFTIMMYIKRSLNGQTNFKYETTSARYWTMKISEENSLSFSYGIGNVEEGSVVASTLPADNNWHHVAVSYGQSDTTKLYLDGVKIMEKDNMIFTITESGKLELSIMPESGSSIGVDEIHIYRGVISEQDIKEIINGQIVSTERGCISSVPNDYHPLKILSYVERIGGIEIGKPYKSQVVIQAHNSPVDTVCQICATPFGGGGCKDIRVTIK